jgi:hypothetical protein
MSDCVFCKIVAGRFRRRGCYEDEHTLAFMDLGQVNPGHVLVAVKKHAENLYALDETQAAAVRARGTRVRARIRDAFKPEGCRCIRRTARRPARPCPFPYASGAALRERRHESQLAGEEPAARQAGRSRGEIRFAPALALHPFHGE